MFRNSRRFVKLEFWGFVFTVIMSFLLHFIYPLTNCPLAATLGAANESVWEHTKIIFLPYLLFAVIELWLLRPSWRRFFVAKTAGLLSIDVFLISFFYTYSGILGHNVLWVDIASAVAWAALAHYISYRLYTGRAYIEHYLGIAAIAFVMMLAAFFVFTWYPPRINLFLDTSGGFYGPAP